MKSCYSYIVYLALEPLILLLTLLSCMHCVIALEDLPAVVLCLKFNSILQFSLFKLKLVNLHSNSCSIYFQFC